MFVRCKNKRDWSLHPCALNIMEPTHLSKEKIMVSCDGRRVIIIVNLYIFIIFRLNLFDNILR